MKNILFFLAILAGAVLAILSAPASGAVLATFGVVGTRNLSNAELEHFAKNFSSFDGEDMLVNNYDDEYVGYDDDILDFGGPGRSFIDGLQVDRVFTMRIVNNLATNETVILLPGYNWYPTESGTSLTNNGVTGNIVLDGNIKTVNGANLVGSGTPSSIKGFLSYIMKNPTQCYMIRISTDVNHTDNLDEALIMGEMTPFAGGGFKPLPIQNAILPSNLNQKIALIPTPNLKLENNIMISLNILAGANVAVSFYCGASASLGRALAVRMKAAQKTISKVQNDQQLKMLVGKG
jgi:hypothetical protein